METAEVIDLLSKKAEKSLNTLKNEILNCRICEDKFQFQPNPIFWGNPGAKIFHISQAPSKNVHDTSKPFNDQSGRRLREWYQVTEDVFYNPDIFYITAVGHCFPGKDGKGGDIKPPRICAEQWLRKEMQYVNNDIYLIIGREASSFFFPKEDFTQLVFQDKILNGKKAFVLPHPSPLNSRWLKNNPEFLCKRLPEIRKNIHAVIS